LSVAETRLLRMIPVPFGYAQNDAFDSAQSPTSAL